MADENEVKALADRLYDAAVSNAGSPSISVWETAQHAAREAMRWRDETRPQQPAAAVPEVDQLANVIREAGDVLEAVRDSGVLLPPNWRWPLIDELHGMAAMLAAAERKGE